MQKTKIKDFIEFWSSKEIVGEKQSTQLFWIDLLTLLGAVDATRNIEFELPVQMENIGYIDAYIKETRVLIEQKSSTKNLNEPVKQSDGSMLTPIQQAKKYKNELNFSLQPRWVVTSNFKEIYIYDMEYPNNEPEVIKLLDLERQISRLSFLVDSTKEKIKKQLQVSMEAGEIVGKIYDAFAKEYHDIENINSQHSLNKLCVRLVFCLYAEDSEVFTGQNMFFNYLKNYPTQHMRKALIELFQVLNTPLDKRDLYIEADLAQFPYVNGGLFADESIEIPHFTDDLKNLLLYHASEDFDWSEISPTIFGAVFESTLNPETRRTGGMHYTSVENIHKVIEPLFLNDLTTELEKIKGLKQLKMQEIAIRDFQRKLSKLTFFDPACGSGNFLTETYISLRKLENEALKILQRGQITLGGIHNPIQVSISQFYGIEINDFASTVAQTALWIAESQMMKRTEEIVHMNLQFLPLKTYTNIKTANSLHIDWQKVISRDRLHYIIGNPPFKGGTTLSKQQRIDIDNIYCDEKGKKYTAIGQNDYVSAWFFKASEFMQGTKIRAALVATNSIVQGVQVSSIWKPLYKRFGIHIDFAYRSFVWGNESSEQANVHCVIIGFSTFQNSSQKLIFDNERILKCQMINPYLFDAKVTFVDPISKPICKDIPEMIYGSKPTDGGFLSKYSETEMNNIVKQYPEAKIMFKPLFGADEFINNKKRYCLWLKGISPKLINNIPPVVNALQNVKNLRLASKSAATRKIANTPYLFQQVSQPESDYLLVPSVCSENRKYIPIGFMSKHDIASNLVFIVPLASLYHLGVLTSKIHMAWMRMVAGRLESRYRYSNTIVYNTFIWCDSTEKQKQKIQETAQMILDARALYPECSYAELYSELTMPLELRQAHEANDKAVMQAYGFKTSMSESEIVSKLMDIYQEKINMLK